MPSNKPSPVLRYIRKVAASQSLLELADPQLLERFLSGGDETAFAALVRRHGPMVLGLCLRILHQQQDAEDAFQATFLILSRQARSLRPRTSLAGWLYSVAYRTAHKARLAAARRRKYEGRAPVPQVPDPLARLTAQEAQEILDRELTRLPDKLRLPLVLCYLEGFTRAEAAHHLGWPVTLLKSRLEQGRERLRSRLASRGLALTGVVLASVCLEGTASAAVPSFLVVSTVKAAAAIAGGGAAAALVPTSVAALVEGVLKAMFMTRVKMTALALLVLGSLGLGVGLSTPHLAAGKPGGDNVPTPERGKADAVRLPPEMLPKIGIQTAEIKPRAAQPRVLQLFGSLALDPRQLFRVRSRCARCEVLQIGKPEGQDRSWQPGDTIRQGQVLAVVSSADVGLKKHDLFNALVKLKLDEAIFERLDRAATGIPQVTLDTARRNIEADHHDVAHAVNALKTRGISDDEIAAIRREAREAAAQRKPDTEDMRKSRMERWAKVELRAPHDGMIVERNISQHEIIKDGSVNLFQIGNLDRLLVLVQAPEEDLAVLQALKAGERRWTVRRPVKPDSDRTEAAENIAAEGAIDEIGYLVDPKQHTIVVKGHIDNKKHQLRPGQYIMATLALRPPVAEVVLPASALVEDGDHAYVFVQNAAKKFVYEQRRVFLVRRSKDAVHVRARLTAEQQRQGFQTIRPGEHVVTTGVMELKAFLDDMKADH
jgi:RND family efflux transporter MFP subunit